MHLHAFWPWSRVEELDLLHEHGVVHGLLTSDRRHETIARKVKRMNSEEVFIFIYLVTRCMQKQVLMRWDHNKEDPHCVSRRRASL